MKMAESELSTERQVRTIWHLGGLTAKGLGKRVWTEIGHDDILNYSAALAYSYLGAVFPLLLFLTAFLGFLAAHGAPKVNDLLFNALQQMLPADTSLLLSKTLNEITQAAGG